MFPTCLGILLSHDFSHRTMVSAKFMSFRTFFDSTAAFVTKYFIHTASRVWWSTDAELVECLVKMLDALMTRACGMAPGVEPWRQCVARLMKVWLMLMHQSASERNLERAKRFHDTH